MSTIKLKIVACGINVWMVDLEPCPYSHNDLTERPNKMVDGFVIVIFSYTAKMHYKLHLILFK